MVHDDKHAIYLALTFDVKAPAVDTKVKPLRLQKLNQGSLWTQHEFWFEVSTRKITVDPQPTNTNARRLMIVDDDAEMRTLLAEYFRRLGFEVVEKESAAAALQTVTK